MQIKRIRLVLALLSALPLGPGLLRAQTASNPTPASSTKEDEENTVILSPFIVSAEEDKGYLANATAVGGRVRTELKDIASAISVVTTQFLTDTKANDNQSLLKYTTNTEVGGIYGNYAGVGNTYINGAGESAVNFLRPSQNTRVRGLDSADNTRDLVKTDIPWNGFNVGRVDFQRGPNSILFGQGSPAGIINASTNTAGFKNGGSVENQIGSFGSLRQTLDYNYVLVPKTLAIRLDAVYDDQKYRQEPAFNKNRTIFGALRWDPKLFGDNSTAHTSIRVNYEHGDVKANRPHVLPPNDRISPFFDPNALNRRLIDTAVDYQTGLYPWKSGSSNAGGPFTQTANNWISSGSFGGSNPQLFYAGSSTPILASAGTVSTYYGINHGIGGFPFSVPAGVADLGEYANNVEKYGAQNNLPPSLMTKYAGGLQGFWKGQSITDPNIFDFYHKLLDGPTKKEWQGWESYNFTLEQTFLDDRLGFQAIYDRQHYHDGGQSILGWGPSITIDNNLYTTEYPSAYTSVARRNPNAGRAYVSGSGGGSGRWTDRENVILTGRGELRASDFLDGKSLLARILGHHVITGAYSKEKYQVEDRNWALYAATNVWSDLIGSGYTLDSQGNSIGNATGGLKNGDTVINSTIFLSPSLLSADPKNLHLSAITSDVAPAAALPIRYYDSHWNRPTNPSDPNYVDPTAAWTNIALTNGVGESATDGDTQANNPLNYVGWKTATVPILNADKGDIDQLYRNGYKVQKKSTSKGGTWQAYLFDDAIVATVGYRKDTTKTRSGQAKVDNTGIAQVNSYGLDPLNPAFGVDEGSSTSWGIVARLPKSLRGKLPWGSDVSLGYSDGKNTRVENRFGFSGTRLPNTKGHTKDISVSVTMLNDRLNFKVTHYDTYNKDANISTIGGQNATLGAATSSVFTQEALGTAEALLNQAGLDGNEDTLNWYWNWAWARFDGSPYGRGDSTWDEAKFQNDPTTIKEKAAIDSWLAQLQPQSWFDAYGIPVNVAKAKAKDYNNAITGWLPKNYVNIPNNGGKINGEYPTGTVDTRSTGWEFEVTGKPINNLDISLNASKQFARQVSLGADLVNYMEASFKKYTSPAGDLRQWWAGDSTLKSNFLSGVWSAYQFQQGTNGKLVNEMSPWRANLSATYRIDHGVLKGAFVGGSYRWQQGTILGYGMNTAGDNLDIEKPIWSKAEDWVDLWAGYKFKLTRKIDWTTQVNLRNVGDKMHLKAISVQPDGTGAGYRIEEGMTWLLSNTLSF